MKHEESVSVRHKMKNSTNGNVRNSGSPRRDQPSPVKIRETKANPRGNKTKPSQEKIKPGQDKPNLYFIP